MCVLVVAEGQSERSDEGFPPDRQRDRGENGKESGWVTIWKLDFRPEVLRIVVLSDAGADPHFSRGYLLADISQRGGGFTTGFWASDPEFEPSVVRGSAGYFVGANCFHSVEVRFAGLNHVIRAAGALKRLGVNSHERRVVGLLAVRYMPR